MDHSALTCAQEHLHYTMLGLKRAFAVSDWSVISDLHYTMLGLKPDKLSMKDWIRIIYITPC